MKYVPVNMTPEELLEKADFGRQYRTFGWVRPRIKKQDCVVLRAGDQEKIERQHRLHALVQNGEIDLHLDTLENGEHRAGKFGKTVQRCIEEFRALDIARVPAVATV